MRQRGFSLLELLVVLVIIGPLASYVGLRYFAQAGESETKIARAQIDAFDKALAQYRLDVGRLIAEAAAAGQVRKEYLYLGDIPVAVVQ